MKHSKNLILMKLNNDEIKELLNNAKIPTSGRNAVIFGKNESFKRSLSFKLNSIKNHLEI